jgi:diketogulonate reductase-like aldo/keto reductase
LTICKIKPIINQIEAHSYLPQQPLVDCCQKNGIVAVEHTCIARRDSCQKEDVNVLKDELICDIAAKNGKTPAQIVLK